MVVLLYYFMTKRLREERVFNIQGGQVRPSVHPSHLFQVAQGVRERCPQMEVLGVLAVLGDQEALEGPDKRKIYIKIYVSHMQRKITEK